jgi:uncharacterized protein
MSQEAILLLDGRQTAFDLRIAKNFLSRARGLLFRAKLGKQSGLWIHRCASIHTVGMHYALDIIFLDAQNHIVRLCSNVRPFAFRICRQAVSVIELNTGAIALLDLRVGQRIDVK